MSTTNDFGNNTGMIFMGELYCWGNMHSHTKILALKLPATRDKKKITKRIASFLITFGISTPDQFFKTMKEVAMYSKAANLNSGMDGEDGGIPG